MSDEQTIESAEEICEVKRVIRINSKGQKTRKIKCQRGFKRKGNRCVRMTAQEKQRKKKAVRKMIRTKHSHQGAQKRGTRRRLKAMKKRRARGL